MRFDRILDLDTVLRTKSGLLLGPRRTGKSWLVRETLPSHLALNLLHADTYALLARRPETLRELVTPGTRLVSIDEIQKLPALMDEVHSLIETRPDVRFLLTGSSARKLKRQHTALMAGRARTHHLFPLVTPELPPGVDQLAGRLLRGSLPAVVTSPDPFEELRDYAGDYLREEIAAEGYARNLDAFARFLPVAAACQAGEVNFETVGSDAQVPSRTVREYFHILEDTLVGTLLPPFTRGGKRKPVSRSKFFLFDVGVYNALMGVRELPAADATLGTQMESVVFQELRAYLSYARDDRPLTYWRTHGGHEVDFLIGDEIAIEVKATRSASPQDTKGLRALAEETTLKERLLVTRDPLPRRLPDGIEVLPFDRFTADLWGGRFGKSLSVTR